MHPIYSYSYISIPPYSQCNVLLFVKQSIRLQMVAPYLSSNSPSCYYLPISASLQGRSDSSAVTCKASSEVGGIVEKLTGVEKDVMNKQVVVNIGADDRRILSMGGGKKNTVYLLHGCIIQCRIHSIYTCSLSTILEHGTRNISLVKNNTVIEVCTKLTKVR